MSSTSSSSRLQLSFSAKGLKNTSGMPGSFRQTSDPFCIVTVRGDSPDNPPKIIGYTNVVYNNLNPDWSTVIILDGYKFGVPYFIEVGVFDFSTKNSGQKESDLAQESSVTHMIIQRDIAENRRKFKNFPHKPMGTAFFEIGEVLGSRGNVASKTLQTGGNLLVHLEPSKGATGNLFQLKLGGQELIKPSWRKQSSPSTFFQVCRRVEKPTGDVLWNSVFRSNVVKLETNPLWQEAVLDLETLCNGDLDRCIKIVVWDYRRSGKHLLLGEIKTSVRGLMEARTKTASPDDFLALQDSDDLTVGGLVADLDSNNLKGKIVVLEANIVEPKKQKTRYKSTPTNIGLPSNINFSERPRFVDYIAGGCQVGLAVAIDFTASNGHPGKPGSLHNTDPHQLNDYEKAIVAVGSILAKYDTDQKFPVWGFGAKINGTRYDCFQCGEVEEAHGVDGILEAYRNVFQSPFQMCAKSELTEVIKTAAAYATHQQEQALQDGRLSYNILLVLTAGNLENIRETKLELNAASQSPLSVVIVGIGDSDFTDMEFLDADYDPKDPDITQFVRFNDYKGYTALSEAVLEEIPDQLVDFYYQKGILPGQAEQYDSGKVLVQTADGQERIAGFLQ